VLRAKNKKGNQIVVAVNVVSVIGRGGSSSLTIISSSAPMILPTTNLIVLLLSTIGG